MNAFTRLARLGTLALAWSGGGSLLQAQPRAYLVHGGFSDGSTWTTAAGQIGAALGIDVRTPTLAQQIFQTQASSLVSDFGSSVPALAGHSNGGLVSRYASGLDDVAGIVSVASPHSGVPLTNRLGEVNNLASWIAIDLALLALPYFNDGPWHPAWYDVETAYLAVLFVHSIATTALASVAETLVNPGAPFFAQIQPGSDFLFNTLPGVENMSVPRFGLQVAAANGYSGGPLMLTMSGNDSELWGNIMWVNGAVLLLAGWDIINTVAQDDLVYLIAGFAATDLGEIFLHWGERWCNMVTEYNQCEPFDGLIPISYQVMPNATNTLISDEAHTRQTSSPSVINYVQQRIANILGL
jgi:hypothetical protein